MNKNLQTKTFKLVLSALLSLTLTVPAMAMKSSPGLPVKKITFASDIDTWQVIDNTHVVVSVNANRNYLLTLGTTCHGLTISSQVGISSSNNTVYAGFDYITADGARCSIRAISKLSLAETRALRG